jgi:hypothetical protein
LTVLIGAELFPIGAFSQDPPPGVENVRYEVSQDLVYVYYDLKGPADRPMRINLTLYRESTPLFVYRPVNLTGDLGGVVFPGQGRRIVWDFTKEFPEGLAGEDYYFVVEAQIIEKESSNTLYWVGGGALVVAGLAALLLIGGGEDTPPPPQTNFPAPPGRP